MCAGLFYVVGQLSFGKQYNDFSEFFVGGGGDQERNGQPSPQGETAPQAQAHPREAPF